MLRALSEAELRAVLERALADASAASGAQPLGVPDDVRDLVAREARGDARRALRRWRRRRRSPRPTPAGAQAGDDRRSSRRRCRSARCCTTRPAKSTTTSSARSSSPCAAAIPTPRVYWMVRMLEAGEDPLFVLRRMVIFASEDIGNADPRALMVAVAARRGVPLLGLPEGIIPMTQAAIYLRDRAQVEHDDHDVRGGQGATSTRTARCPSPSTSATRRPSSPRSWATAPATSTRTTSKVTTCARTICPTPSAATATTSPPTPARNAPSPNGSRGCGATHRTRQSQSPDVARVSPLSVHRVFDRAHRAVRALLCGQQVGFDQPA